MIEKNMTIECPICQAPAIRVWMLPVVGPGKANGDNFYECDECGSFINADYWDKRVD